MGLGRPQLGHVVFSLILFWEDHVQEYASEGFKGHPRGLQGLINGRAAGASILGDEMYPKMWVIYPILLKFLLGYMNHKPF